MYEDEESIYIIDSIIYMIIRYREFVYYSVSIGTAYMISCVFA